MQYKTFAGKWHLGSKEQESLPTDHGFEINKGEPPWGTLHWWILFSFQKSFSEDKIQEKGMTFSMKLPKRLPILSEPILINLSLHI